MLESQKVMAKNDSSFLSDFLPILIYVIVHCGLVSAEIEADFMWGLLQPSLLTGEGGYYLTTLSSAVLVLKNFQNTYQLAPAQVEVRNVRSYFYQKFGEILHS